MENYLKLSLFLLVLVVLVLAVGVWHLITREEVYRPNPVRPKDFPAILVAPENAEILDHSVASDSQGAPHSYGLNFVIQDPYPSEDTLNLIRKHLSSNGFQRLDNLLQLPLGAPASVCRVPEYLDPETVDLGIPKNKQKGPQAIRFIMEDWLNKEDEVVSVNLYYRADLETRKVHRDELYVNLSFFERESWIRPWILKYKELYTDEFAGINVPNEPADK